MRHISYDTKQKLPSAEIFGSQARAGLLELSEESSPQSSPSLETVVNLGRVSYTD